jgi:hypothetical protein
LSESDVYELVIDGEYASNEMMNVFGFVQKSVTAGNLSAQLITSWRAAMETSWRSVIAAGLTINAYRAQRVVPGGDARSELFPSSSNTSTGSGSVQATQVAALISWQTARAGRSYRGRTYLGPVPGTFAAGSTLITAGTNAYNAFIAAMMGAYGPAGSDADFELAIISRVQAGTELTTPIATPVVSGVVRNVLATQRRRRLGVGS